MMRALLASAILMALASVSVDGQTITTALQSHSGTLSETSLSGSFTFNAFDGSLGTLTAVVFTFSASGIVLNPEAVNSDASSSHPVTKLSGTINGDLNTFSSDGHTLFDDISISSNYNTGTISQTVAPSSTYVRSTGSGTTASSVASTPAIATFTDAPTLADYTISGAGGPTIVVQAVLSNSAGGSVGDGSTLITFGIATYSLSYSATLQYQYVQTGGDPQIVGFQNQRFQIHGTPDEHYSLISAASYFLNSRFVYMANGLCNYNDTECFSHPGTYIAEIGLLSGVNRVKVASGPHAVGLTVYINEKLAPIGTKAKFDNFTSVHVISHNRVVLKTMDFVMSAVNSDMFLNMGVEFTNTDVLRAGRSEVVIPNSASPAEADRLISKSYPEFQMHGLLGQTWRNIVWPSKRLYQGIALDYQVSSLFSPNFLYTQYVA